MKQILLFTILSCSFLGCKFDKVKPRLNEILFNNISHPIDQGIIENYGSVEDGIYNIDLSLFSNNVKPVLEDGQIVNYSGKGHLLYIEIFTARAGELPLGTYNFNTAQIAGTFDDGLLGLNVDFETGQGDGSYIDSGTIKVLKNTAGIYELEMTLTNDKNVTFTCYYKGKLTNYEYSAIKNPDNEKASTLKKQRLQEL